MKKIFTALSLILLNYSAYSQGELTAPFMPNIPQSMYSNPISRSEYKVVIGFPGISSFSAAGLSNGFTMHDAKPDSIGGPKFDFGKALNAMKEKNRMNFNAALDLFSFGIKVKDNYFTFNVTEHLAARLAYTRGIISVIYNQELPASEQISLGKNAFNITHHREYALGFNRKINNLTIGARGKLLFGKANIYTERFNGSVSSNSSDNYKFDASADIKVNTSSGDMLSSLMGGSNDSSNTINEKDYLLNKKNIGLALDLGVSYTIIEGLSITGAINNLGFINWKSDTKNYSITGTAKFNGEDIVDENDNVKWDTLQKIFNNTQASNKYKTTLTANSYLMLQYSLHKSTNVGAGFFAEYYKGVRPAFTTNISQRLGRIVNITASYSIQNRTYNNLGAGIMIKLLPLQIYAVTDNVIAAFKPETSKNLNIRAGINFVFGNTNKVKKEKESL